MKDQQETIRNIVRHLNNPLERRLIPLDPALWDLDQFEAFVEERKRLIGEKFAWLLQGTASSR